MKSNNPLAMLGVLYGCAFVAAFNENIINVALPDIMSAFSVDSITAQWLVTGYMIVATIVVASMSFVSRRFSLRQIFIFAAVVIIVGSVAALFAPTFPVLLAVRLGTAVGTGLFIPTMMTTVLAVAPKQKLGTYMAIGQCCITLGPAMGPVISGVMVTAFGWRGIFVPLCVAMALLLVAGLFLLKDFDATSRPHLDVLSLASSCLGVTLVVFGLTQLTANLAVAAVSLVAGLACVAFFAKRQLNLEDPMMNVRPAANPRFSVAILLAVVAMMTTFSMSVLMPLYFQGALGFDALASGLLVLVPILGNALASIVGGRAMDHSGEWPLLPIGFACIAAGMAGVWATSGSLDVVVVIAMALIAYVGVGLVMSPSQTAGLSNLKSADYPHGVSMMNTFVQMAGALGPSLFVGVYSSSMAQTLGSGCAANVASATGFGSAVLVATVIGIVGFAVSIWYAWSARKLKRPSRGSAKRTVK